MHSLKVCIDSHVMSPEVSYQITLRIVDEEMKAVVTRHLEKTYDQFCVLHLQLNKVVPDLVDLPQKSLFKVQGKEIKKRQQDLNRYLNSLIYRPDILNSALLQSFLSIDTKERGLIQQGYLPQVVEEINFLSQPVMDFLFLPHEQALLLTTARAHSTKNSLINMFTDPKLLSKFKWKGFKKDKNSESKSDECAQECCVSPECLIPPSEVQGTVLVYGPDERGSYVNTSKLDFRQGVTACAYHPTTRHLTLGFDCGVISLMHFSENHVLTQVSSLQHHKAKITALGMNHDKQVCISASMDKALVFWQLDETSKYKDNYKMKEKYYPNEIRQIEMDQRNQRAFLADTKNTIYILQSEYPFDRLQEVIVGHRITRFTIDYQIRFLLVGGLEGQVSIYDLNKPGKEKFIHYVNQLGVTCMGKGGVKEVGFNISRKQVYVEHMGSINIIEALTGKSIDSFVVTQAQLTRFQYFDQEDMMVAVCSDNSVKVVAMSEEVRQNYIQGRDQRIESYRQNQLQQAPMEDQEEDEDEYPQYDPEKQPAHPRRPEKYDENEPVRNNQMEFDNILQADSDGESSGSEIGNWDH